jgi:sec-independent protein translocase protein TatB
MSFQDGIFLFILALLLFGPKRLPVLARELGKWVGEFRRASNEFKMQMEEEMRLSEQTDRQKQIAAMEAAAPVAPPLPEPEHPHMPAVEAAVEVEQARHPERSLAASGETESKDPEGAALSDTAQNLSATAQEPLTSPYETVDGVRTPVLPIATSGELSIMPPATGLPTPRSNGTRSSALGGLLDSIPPAPEAAPAEPATETALHGD